jgi:hypothetical protein
MNANKESQSKEIDETTYGIKIHDIQNEEPAKHEYSRHSANTLKVTAIIIVTRHIQETELGIHKEAARLQCESSGLLNQPEKSEHTSSLIAMMAVSLQTSW